MNPSGKLDLLNELPAPRAPPTARAASRRVQRRALRLCSILEIEATPIAILLQAG